VTEASATGLLVPRLFLGQLREVLKLAPFSGERSSSETTERRNDGLCPNCGAAPLPSELLPSLPAGALFCGQCKTTWSSDGR
jgi:hypothetical protein